ncbi:MAG: caspase family protein [Bacteroidia bacterium]|nr:caspase family protein [Bacteroidia bacterium]
MKKALVLLTLLCCVQLYAQENITEMLAAKGYGRNTRAIIVANEDYQSYSPVYVDNEELAIMQAEKFQQMLIKKLGVLPQNIQFYPDALNTHIKLAITKLQRDLPNDAKIIFYYRGKMFTDKIKSDTWLIPVDVSDEETFYMFGMKDLCTRLNTINKGGITILLDAQPDVKAGSASIIENGYISSEVPLVGAKNMDLFTLKLPPPPVKEPPPVTAKKPEITITEPLAKSNDTGEQTAIIKGTVKSDCRIEVMAVNGQESHLSEDGQFMARVALDEGENIIAIEAKNCAGWTRDFRIFNLISTEPDAEDIADSTIFAETNTLKEQGKNFAVVVGVSKYTDPMMPDLFYPIFDARKVVDVITGFYTFDKKNVLLLENPTKGKIIKTLDSLDKVITSKDNLLIFYAGHGNWDERNSMGYWLPSDAAARLLNNWLMNSIITAYVSQSKARHTLVIADACFGGSIFRTRAFKPEAEKSLSEMYLKTSKKAMTSGDLTEVPDESIFVKTFIEQLSSNKENYLPTEKLFFSIKPNIVKEVDLIPQFGTIKNAGDQGGDFIFFRKQEQEVTFR